MRKALRILLPALLLLTVAAPVLAWEIGLKGEYEYRLRYLGRTGNSDLFGLASLQDVGPTVTNNAGLYREYGLVGFAGPTLYNRGLAPALASVSSQSPVLSGTPRWPSPISPTLLITRGGYSTTESDAFFADSRLTLRPEIKVNSAIRVFGVYNIGGYRNKYFQNAGTWPGYDLTKALGIGPYIQSVGTPPFERYYMSQTSMNAYDTAAVGSWEQFRATIQTPWAVFSLGVKDFPLGTGATLGYNTRAEEFLMVVPYGPFRLLYAVWPSKSRFDTFFPVEGWYQVPDAQTKSSFMQGAFVTYDNADVSIGAGSIVNLYHLKKAEPASNVMGALGQLGAVNGFDDSKWISMIYMKYFNGRFFANAEYAWINVDQYRLPYNTGNGTNLLTQLNAAPFNLEAYHFFAETGTVLGPAKLSLMYALCSGFVRNNTRAQYGDVFTPLRKYYAPWPINYPALAPYQFLMFETFAGGNNGGWTNGEVVFASDEHGMLSDAYAFAGRLDWAVAANLNLWVSYIWAHRLERAGTFKGGTLSDGNTATAAQRIAWVANNFGAASGEVGGPVNPFVDDGYIGWEGNAGVDWKLLEGLTMSWRYSYWQPGEWFDQAYQVFGVRNGAKTNDAMLIGRDAIQAVTGSVIIDF